MRFPADLPRGSRCARLRFDGDEGVSRRALPARSMLLLFAAPAAAQIMVPSPDPFAGGEAEDKDPSKTSYPLGRSDVVARQMVLGLRLERLQRDLCAELGCLMIINEVRRATRLPPSTPILAGADGKAEWSSNRVRPAALSTARDLALQDRRPRNLRRPGPVRDAQPQDQGPRPVRDPDQPVQRAAQRFAGADPRRRSRGSGRGLADRASAPVRFGI